MPTVASETERGVCNTLQTSVPTGSKAARRTAAGSKANRSKATWSAAHPEAWPIRVITCGGQFCSSSWSSTAEHLPSRAASTSIRAAHESSGMRLPVESAALLLVLHIRSSARRVPTVTHLADDNVAAQRTREAAFRGASPSTKGGIHRLIRILSVFRALGMLLLRSTHPTVWRLTDRRGKDEPSAGATPRRPPRATPRM